MDMLHKQALQIASIVVGVFLLSSCSETLSSAPTRALPDYDGSAYYFPEDQWQHLADPEEAGWSKASLASIRELHAGMGTDAALIVHRGLIVYSFGDIQTTYPVYSVRKSLMSLMIGTELDAGRLKVDASLEELGIDDEPPLSAAEKQATVEDLLTSRSGVYHAAAFETRSMREDRPPRGSARPGEKWFYNNWDFNTLLTIFNESSGTDFFESFESRISRPLMMEYFSLADTEYRYERDKSAHPAYLFEMSALDLARVGLLYLRRGQWDGETIVSRDWIEQSTRVSHAWYKSTPEFGYGYMWHVKDYGFYAAGNGGQRLYVFPDYDLLLVHLVDRSGGKRVDGKKLRRVNSLLLTAHPKKSCREISVCKDLLENRD